MTASRKILIVESSADLRAGLRSRLEDMGHTVISAATSAEALALIEWHGLPHLMLVSSTLEYRPGSFFLDAVRDLPRYTWIPAFQLLAPGDKPLSGMAGYLELPISARQLEVMLSAVEAPDAPQASREMEKQRNAVPHLPHLDSSFLQ